MAKKSKPKPRGEKKPRDMLELRLHEAATPARVRRAAQLFENLLAALRVDNDVGTTLEVENRFLKATVRTRTKTGVGAVNEVISLVQAPLKPSKKPHPARPEIAGALAQYAREEYRYRPELWKPRGKEPICELDETFAAMMEAIADAPPPDAHIVKGTTYVYSKIFRVGRADEQKPYKARINVEGRPLDVPIQDHVDRGMLFDAARNDTVMRVRIAVEWLHVDGCPPRTRNQLIVGAERSARAGAGARIIALAGQHKVITGDELPAVLSSINRDREGGEGDE